MLDLGLWKAETRKNEMNAATSHTNIEKCAIDDHVPQFQHVIEGAKEAIGNTWEIKTSPKQLECGSRPYINGHKAI